MRFSFRQLEYFVAAGETGSVTRAAQGSHSSQPTVSAAIAKLEASLGVQLFVRHHAQGLSLTPEGRRFLGEAKALLRHASDVERFATALSDEVGGTLDLGCLVTLAPLVAPSLVRGFQSANIPVGLSNQGQTCRYHILIASKCLRGCPMIVGGAESLGAKA